MTTSGQVPGDPPVQVAAILERIGGDPALLVEMAEIFLAEYPERLHALRQAVRAGNAAEIEAAAHGLRSALHLFGAEVPAGLARELEARARGGDVGGAPALLARLEPELERIFAFFTDSGWRERM